MALEGSKATAKGGKNGKYTISKAFGGADGVGYQGCVFYRRFWGGFLGAFGAAIEGETGYYGVCDDEIF